jgi:DMSO reductase anchor subunit
MLPLQGKKTISIIISIIDGTSTMWVPHIIAYKTFMSWNRKNTVLLFFLLKYPKESYE